MKKLMNNYRMMAMALLAVLGFTSSTFATPYEVSPAELKFIGHDNSHPVFQLVLKNSTAAEYMITVKDSDKKVLLSEKIKGENISRRYILDAEEMSWIGGTTFEVTNIKTKETSVYEINNKSSVVENVVIAKL